MNNKIILIVLSLTTLLFSDDKLFWDLGVVIKSNNNKIVKNNNSLIKPLTANTQLVPSYKKTENMDFSNISILPLDKKHLIKLLYLINEYFSLTKYIQELEKNNVDLSNEQIIIYSDALYRIGNYEQAINIINLLSDDYPGDEKYFKLAIYNKKNGDLTSMVKLLNDLILEYPNSEYIKLAKLQTQRIN